MIINFTKDQAYRSQRKTKKRPGAACNVTVATMCCLNTGNSFESPASMLPEDYLMSLLESKEAWSLLNKYIPGAKCNPWNTSYCIAWAVNKAVGKKICKVEEVSFIDMIEHIVINGGAIGVGGSFTASGHFVSIAGFVTDQLDLETCGKDKIDVSKVTHIVVDDPWGNYLKKYKDIDGNNISIPIAEFKKVIFGKRSTKTVQMYYKS